MGCRAVTRVPFGDLRLRHCSPNMLICSIEVTVKVPLHFAILVIACASVRTLSGQASAQAPTQTSDQHTSQQAGAEKPKALQKVMVLYKSWASAADKSRVHDLLHGKVSTSFSDKTTEEVAIPIPANQETAKYVQGVLKAANQDPAVAHAYKSPTYSLQ
jgi:hypothetical protein